MSKPKSLWLLAFLAVACGGTSTTDGSGGSSSGGSANNGGSVSNGGTVSNGGSVSNGGTISSGGSVSNGGTVSSGGTGGAGTYDPRCPATQPVGMCTDDETGASCQYNQFNGCLCYRTQGFVYPCPQVDPSCPSGGTGGTGAGTPPPSSAGVGGVSAKIAVPPSQICSCTAGNWTCSFGI